ncbi:tRNA (guanosine(46)-N7)-methyltransferase TrmB [Aquihabitans sp. McL0605]|uniref:tRNA (guanosine(46)-N7)-methyltransferase TrmB n=1 Tax=Aquihabitans sp. McL0605 TaxID=3415671 RepID=UPI003CF3E49F
MTEGHASTSPPRPTGVRTTKRRGRTSTAQIQALAALGEVWQVGADDVTTARRRAAAFGRTGPLLVDLGVGDGRATIDWAVRRPDADVVAIELHRPGIVKLLRALDATGPANVRVIEDDALAVLDAVEPGSVRAVRVLFPDPWPKRRHVARRLVDRRFVTHMAEILEPGGVLHLATDWADYAQHMASMVATEPRFVRDEAAGRPARPITAYEQRGLDARRTIVDLVFHLDGSRPSGPTDRG